MWAGSFEVSSLGAIWVGLVCVKTMSRNTCGKGCKVDGGRVTVLAAMTAVDIDFDFVLVELVLFIISIAEPLLFTNVLSTLLLLGHAVLLTAFSRIPPPSCV